MFLLTAPRAKLVRRDPDGEWMARKSQREAILDAAERVIGAQGLAHATLEAIAAEAGISKGGLLYHFSNKKDLLLKLIERHGQRLAKRREEIMAGLPDGPGRALKAYILARLTDPSRRNMSLSKMVGVLEDEDLRVHLTAMKKKELHALEEELSRPERTTVFILAMEGLWLMDLFKVPVFTPEFREKVIAELLKMVDNASRCNA